MAKMTRVDFELIAASLFHVLKSASPENRAAVREVINQMSLDLKTTNPRFNRDRFLKAAGYYGTDP